MQQALYNTISTNGISGSAKTSKIGTRLVRWIATKWDMAAVIGLMVSTAAYGVFALAHVA